jgi:hypothetical protein
MKNIIWKKPDGHVAVTMINGEINSADHASELVERGDIPATWIRVAVDFNLPANWLNREWLWDDAAGSMVPDVTHGRTMMWESIKAERDRRKSGGIKVKVGSIYKWFNSDADSRIQLIGLKDKARDLLAAGGAMTDKLTILGQTVKWKTMDGSFVEITAQLAFDIVAAAGDLDAQLFATAEAHKAAMEASADPASYDFSTGWPPSFGE